MTRRRLLMLLTLVVLVAASVVLMRNDLDPKETVNAWLLCDECSDGELSRVIALDRRAISLLTASLNTGPDSQQRANIRTQLRSDAAAVSRLGEMRVGVSAIDTNAFFDRYVDNYAQTYRERALLALTVLKDTARARKAIDSLVALDAVAPLGWSNTLRTAALAHRTGVTELKILPIPDLRVGQTRIVRVQIVGDQNAVLTWSSTDAAVATVSGSNRVITGLGVGRTIVRACWTPQGGDPPICAIRAVRVTG